MGSLVLLSGGQDSTTALFLALSNPGRVEGLFIHYGQRHAREYEAAKAVAKLARVPLWESRVDLGGAVASSLTDPSPIGTRPDGLPTTFVPGRNLWMACLAAGVASSRELSTVVLGTNAVDFSGYPDCRPSTLDALEKAIQLGVSEDLTISTPLASMSKAQIVATALVTPGCWEALALTWTCYLGGERPCGSCPSCALRAGGFRAVGVSDPAL